MVAPPPMTTAIKNEENIACIVTIPGTQQQHPYVKGLVLSVGSGIYCSDTAVNICINYSGMMHPEPSKP